MENRSELAVKSERREKGFSAGVKLETAVAFGVVLNCRRRVGLSRVEELLREYAVRFSGGGSVTLTEETDWGSLVSPRPENFHFLQVARGGEVFSLCRFRQIEGGYEFLFNLSNTGLTPHEVEEFLLGHLPAEILKREFF